MAKYSMSIDFHDKNPNVTDSKIGITKEEVCFEHRNKLVASATWDQLFRMYFLTHFEHKDFTIQDILDLRE